MNNENQNQYSNNQPNVDPFSSTAIQPDDSVNSGEVKSLSWTASEFIQHDKGIFWYLSLASLTLIIALLAYILLDEDRFSLGIILLLGVIFGIAASRKPRILKYSVDEHGLLIDNKDYRYESFRSFSVTDEGSVYTLILTPVQRLSPLLTIYVPEDTVDDVVDLLGMYLPVVQHQSGLIDKFLSRIRF